MRKKLLLNKGFGLLVVISWIIQSCAPVATKPVHPEVAARLHLAASSGNLLQIEWCLLKGHDVDTPAQDGSTPLHQAARNNQIAVAKLLLKNNANVNARNNNGETPLQAANKLGHSEMVELLKRYVGR